MEGTAYHDLAGLLRQAALQEAASRAKTRSPLNANTSEAAAEASSSSQKVTAEAEVEAEELVAVYEDEKAKNDALARTIDDRLQALASIKKSQADEVGTDDRKRLELEWQQLEFAIRALEQGTLLV